LSRAAPEIEAAAQLVVHYRGVGGKLDAASPHHDKVIQARAKGGPAECLSTLLQAVKSLVSQQKWTEANAAADRLQDVAQAMTVYEAARAAAVAKRVEVESATKLPRLKQIHAAAATFFNEAVNAAEANRSDEASVYRSAGDALTALLEVYQSMIHYAAEYRLRDRALASVLGMYPEDDQAGKQQDGQLAELLAKLTAGADKNKDARRDAYDQAAGELAKIDELLAQIKVERREKVREYLAGEFDGTEYESLIGELQGNGAGQTAAAELYQKLGKDGLQQFLADFDVHENDPDQKLAAAGIANLHQTVGMDGIALLQRTLGGSEQLGVLVAPDGTTALIAGLYEEFNEDPRKLKEFAEVSCGGDPQVLSQLAHQVCSGRAEDLAMLVNSFGARELQEVIQCVGPASCGDTLQRLVTENYGGDVSLLKTHLYDRIDSYARGSDAEAIRKKMLTAAPTFEQQDLPDHPQQPNVPSAQNAKGLRATSSKSLKHFLERHTRTYFDPGGIKPDNTQWPPGTTDSDVAAYLEEAIKEANQPNRPSFSDGDNAYKKQLVPLATFGIWAQIGYYNNSKQITQFFPIPADRMTYQRARMSETDFNAIMDHWPSSPPQAVAIEEFDDSMMRALMHALA
jgi:hypothetical protein